MPMPSVPRNGPEVARTPSTTERLSGRPASTGLVGRPAPTAAKRAAAGTAADEYTFYARAGQRWFFAGQLPVSLADDTDC
jgi:hypothetical protein